MIGDNMIQKQIVRLKRRLDDFEDKDDRLLQRKRARQNKQRKEDGIRNTAACQNRREGEGESKEGNYLRMEIQI